MSNKLEVISKVVDQCSKDQLHNIISPLADIPASCTKAEMISHCLNTELGSYGFNTYTSPDKTTVFVNDETMCKVMDFFKPKGYQPYFTTEQIDRVKAISQVANDNRVDILWAQSGIKKKYYYLKQFGFNGVNLYNVLNTNTVNSAAAALSPTGAATLSMASVVAISWTGSLFFSTIENFIPNTMPRTKMIVSGLKFGTALPIRCVEWTSNQIIGFVESITVGYQLPTNITDVYRLNEGPKLKDIKKFKKPILNWLVEKLNKLNK